MSSRPAPAQLVADPLRPQLWHRMPLAALGFTIVAVIHAAPVFQLDASQRRHAAQRRGGQATAWVTHLAAHLDNNVLPHMPEPFGAEYRQAHAAENQDPRVQLRVTPAMLYSLADTLHVTDVPVPDPVQCLSVSLPMPLLPPVLVCPSPGCGGVLTRHRSGDTTTSWLADTGHATRVPVFAGQCSTCHTPVYPDRYQPSAAAGAQRDREVLFPNPAVIRIGRSVHATRTLGNSLSNAVIHAHMPLSTFGQWWQSSICSVWRGETLSTLQHDQWWRLFIIHHTLRYLTPNTVFSLPLDGDRDDAMVDMCLSLFPSILNDPANADPTLSQYRTHHIPGAAAHHCDECSHAHWAFRDGDRRQVYTDDELLLAHRNAIEHPDRLVTAVVIDGIEKIGHKICAVDNCGRDLTDYREGRFCQRHIEYADRCGVKGCLLDAVAPYPACEHHRALYRQWEGRFGRDRTLFENRRWIRRVAAIEAGEQRQEWEPAVQPWDPATQHYWRARHIKVVEIAVTPCGVPLSWTKFPFAESETNIIRFMCASWPQPHLRPTYIAIDKGCKIIATLQATNQLFTPATGWAQTSNIKVATFHYASHVADPTCVEMCNPNDRRDANLVRLGAGQHPPQPGNARGRGHRAQARRAHDNEEGYQRWFNFEAAEQLNAWLEPFSATMTKMRPQNHAAFLCIILRERAALMIQARDVERDE